MADKLPAGSSYLPPTAASTGYGSPSAQASYGDDYAYDDYEDQQPSYSEEQVRDRHRIQFLKDVRKQSSGFLRLDA